MDVVYWVVLWTVCGCDILGCVVAGCTPSTCRSGVGKLAYKQLDLNNFGVLLVVYLRS